MKETNKFLRQKIKKANLEHYFLEKKIPKYKPEKKPKYRDTYIQKSLEEYIDINHLEDEEEEEGDY